MHIKTKQMQAREKAAAYINNKNELVGRMNPLKLFFCQYGMDRTNAGSGFWHFKDAINQLEAQTGASTDVIGGRIINGSNFIPLLEPGGTFDPIPVNDALALDGVTDVLMISAGMPTDDTNQSNNFIVRDFDGGGFMSARSRVGSTPTAVTFTDDNLVSAAVTTVNATAEDTVTVAAFDRSALASEHRNTGTSGSLIDNTVSMVAANGPITFLQTPEMSLNGDLFAVGLYYFPNGLPLNWKAAASYIGWQWMQITLLGMNHGLIYNADRNVSNANAARVYCT